jgi:integrase
MARKGRVDRGLMQKRNASGKLVWFVRLYHEGKEHRFGSFSTKTAARNFYEKAKLEQKEGRFFPERYHHRGYESAETFFDHYKLTRATLKDQRGEACFFAWWRNRFKGKRLNAITSSALEEARHEILTRGSDPHAETPRPCSPQRVNRYIEWIRHALNVAVRHKQLPSNPVSELRMYKNGKGRTRFLTLEEEQVLCEALGPVHAPLVRLAILTGLRRGEQFAMRWQDIHFERSRLTLPETKAGEEQYVVLSEEAKSILQSMQAVQEAQAIANKTPRSAWVFPSDNPATHLDACNFYRRVFLPTVKALQLDGVTWHTLRHTFASRLAMEGATDYEIAACLRHASTALVKRYAHLSPTHLQGVMERVSSFGKVPAKTTEAEQREGGSEAPRPNGTGTETGKSQNGGEPVQAEALER